MVLDDNDFALQLRIGNYIIPYGETDTSLAREVCMISLDIDDEYMPYVEVVEIGKRNNAKGDILRNFSPIPLCEEWIIRFGLHIDTEFVAWGRRTNIVYFHLCRDFYLVKNNSGQWELGVSLHEMGSIDTGYEGEDEHTIIEYVHQLQNLYFSLSGEVLELI